MIDVRYANAPIFNRRKEEWQKDKILETVRRLFELVNLVEGWEIVTCEWNLSRKKGTKSEELKRHIIDFIRVVVKNPNGKELTYDLQIPTLIQDQFFYMGGFLKIPIFQIYDFPIIFRRKLLKLRTNTITISIDLGRADNGYKINLFNENLPVETVVTACITKEELIDFISSRFEGEQDLINRCYPLYTISQACMNRWEEKTEDEIIYDLGKPFSKQNVDVMKKGRSVAFSIKAAYEIDFFSHPFFKTNSIILELFQALVDGPKPDTDVKRKRVRFSEYVFASLTKKVYDMILTNFNMNTNTNSSRKDKFQIPQSIIVDNCNVSDIVQYNFRINPVAEIAGMLQTTLTGPGGFKKDNVPSHLRDLDPTQMGRICPADTPDRDGCGVVLNMVPVVDINSDGSFGEANEEIITSYPISLVPFLKNDDQVRLQMASNQLKQTILLDESEKPLIRSGCEGNYLEHSTYMYVAKEKGKVAHLDRKFMIVVYDGEEGGAELFQIGPKSTHLNTVDILESRFEENQEFEKGDILCQSTMIKDGELSLGQNLLAGVCIWKGYNYEDGIVLSESVSNSRFTSVHSVDLTFTIESGQVLLGLDGNDQVYNPLPPIGTKIKKGEVIAKIKTLDGEDGFESINIEPYEVVSPVDCTIVDIEIYPNSWNKKVKEFDQFISDLSVSQTDRFVMLQNKLRSHLSKEEVEKFITLNGLSRLDCGSRSGKYFYKRQKIGGVIIRLQAIYKESIGIGDKIANRHGNKGVISKIVPDDQMPVLPDGRKLDIVLNPLGIISRMNVGQLYELHLNEARHQVQKKIDEMENLEEKLQYLQGFLDIIDCTPDRYISEKIIKDFLETGKVFLIQPPFQSVSPEQLFQALQYSGAQFKYQLYDPMMNTYIERPVVVGYIYFLKLVHRSSDKMSARSIGPYSKKTLQPLGGKSKGGAHKFGEMETWATMAHGAENLLEDFITIQSDSPGPKNRLLANFLGNPNLAQDEEYDEKPQSLRLLDSYLKILGLDIIEEERPNICEGENLDE